MKSIKYYKKIYLSEDIDFRDLMQIKKDLIKQPLKANVFLIAMSYNEHDQLDIYHSKYLEQRFYRERPPYIVGIAREKKDAVTLVEKMVQECVNLRGDVNLKAYLAGE